MVSNLQLFADFDGVTYERIYDLERLQTQLARVKLLMSDGRWRTIEEIRGWVGGSENGVSARIRDLRKPKFGALKVDRRRRGGPKKGLFEYRVYGY